MAAPQLYERHKDQPDRCRIDGSGILCAAGAPNTHLSQLQAGIAHHVAKSLNPDGLTA